MNVIPKIGSWYFYLINMSTNMVMTNDTKSSHRPSDGTEENLLIIHDANWLKLSDVGKQLYKVYKQNRDTISSKWITMESQSLVQLILETLAEPAKKKSLDVTLGKPRSTGEILNICNLPQTSGYRMINSLIKNYLLIPDRPILSNRGRQVLKYTSLIESVMINAEKSNVVVVVKFAKNN